MAGKRSNGKNSVMINTKPLDELVLVINDKKYLVVEGEGAPTLQEVVQ